MVMATHSKIIKIGPINTETTTLTDLRPRPHIDIEVIGLMTVDHVITTTIATMITTHTVVTIIIEILMDEGRVSMAMITVTNLITKISTGASVITVITIGIRSVRSTVVVIRDTTYFIYNHVVVCHFMCSLPSPYFVVLH